MHGTAAGGTGAGGNGFRRSQDQRRRTPTPATSQFYTQETDSRLTALKHAVNNFIDVTAAQNAGLADDKQNRISLVTYASSAAVHSDFTFEFDGLKSTVGNLTAAGSTDAGEGMEYARRLSMAIASVALGAPHTKAPATTRRPSSSSSRTAFPPQETRSAPALRTRRLVPRAN